MRSTRLLLLPSCALLLALGVSPAAAQSFSTPSGTLTGAASGSRFQPQSPRAWESCLFSGEQLIDTIYQQNTHPGFGFTAAVEGDLAVIGSPNDDETPGCQFNGTGAVYVFRRVGGQWFEEQKLFSPAPECTGYFGSELALDNGRIVVGASGERPYGVNGTYGAVHIFEHDGASWVPTASLDQPDGSCGRFGSAVEIVGDTLLLAQAGAENCGVGIIEGRIHVYRLNTPSPGWNLQQTLSAADGGPVGFSFALHGGVLVAGSSEAVYVFTSSAGIWTEDAKLVSPNPVPSEIFGVGLAAFGNEIVVGAPYRDGQTFGEGAAFVFRDEGAGWLLAQAIRHPAPSSGGEHFGWDVALSDKALVIGSPGDLMSGAAHVYRRVGARWKPDQVLGSGNPGFNDQYGAVVELDGHRLLTTAIHKDGNGAAYFFQDSCKPDPGSLTRASVSSSGNEANDASKNVRVSGDGRWIAFQSDASNLVPNDTNGERDIFVRDLLTGTIERVSVDSSGAQASGASLTPELSFDGRWVVFASQASDLVAGDANGKTDIFRHDRNTGQTVLVSVDSNGVQADLSCARPGISADGLFIAFDSRASTLAPGDLNGERDVFVHELSTGATTRVSVGPAGAEGNGESRQGRLSGAGHYVVFDSWASTLVAGDTNGARDIFVHDLLTGQTTLQSVSTAGSPGNGDSSFASISSDGQLIAFHTKSTNLVASSGPSSKILVRDLQTGQTWLASSSVYGGPANKGANAPRISGNGGFVVFHSPASNLVPNDTNALTDVFLHDIGTGEVTLISSGPYEADAGSSCAHVSAAAETVVFRSDATNLVPGDTNGVRDAFSAELQP